MAGDNCIVFAYLLSELLNEGDCHFSQRLCGSKSANM